MSQLHDLALFACRKRLKSLREPRLLHPEEITPDLRFSCVRAVCTAHFHPGNYRATGRAYDDTATGLHDTRKKDEVAWCRSAVGRCGGPN